MFDIDRWREIWSSISSNKLRTLLSGLTISLALFVFIVLFGMGNGLQNGFQKEFFQAGAMNMYIFGTQTSESYAGYQKGRQIILDNYDLEYILDNYSEKIKYISGEYDQSLSVKFGGQSGSYSVKGIDKDYFQMINIKLDDGRFLKDSDYTKNKCNHHRFLHDQRDDIERRSSQSFSDSNFFGSFFYTEHHDVAYTYYPCYKASSSNYENNDRQYKEKCIGIAHLL